ncbi:DUF1592 domain-containing protein [Steroidobacter agaridevorans]|nr:DUF1592 domain-containing protein [Steroidobacter agaridevorans]
MRDLMKGDEAGRRRWIVGGVAAVAAIAAVVLLTREPSLPTNAGSPARVRLMTGAQFANSMEYMFGPSIDVGSAFAPLQRVDGLLALNASQVSVTMGQMQDFQRAAVSIASQVMSEGNLDRGVPSHRDALVPCKPAVATEPDDECAATFVRNAGRLLFRRPLSEQKVAELVGNAHQAADSLDDFYGGLQVVLESMLINPQFLLIEDTTEPDPDRSGHRRLDNYGLASRLSFLLWNSIPDEELLDAAEKGELYTRRGRKREVERMLASPRLENGVRAFFDDMFGFDHFDSLSKDPQKYPSITGATLQDAREQTLRTVVDHLLHKNADYRDLFTTRSTFISRALGPVYQVGAAPGWSSYELPANSGRAGILTHVSFLTLHAHPARSSATLRGKALREVFLCQRVPPPPPNVDFSAVEDPDSSLKTAREKLEVHRTNPSCAGCHKITDPIGLTLENFDGAGQFRTTENGAQIDTSGELDGKPFKDAVGLGEALRNSPALPTCLVKQVYSYATGGSINTRDPMLEIFEQDFADSGYRVVDLLRDIAMSEAFSRIVPAPPSKQELAAPTEEIEILTVMN